MDRINFLAQPDFPISTNTFDHMQNMIYLAASLAVLGGDYYILKGCKETEKGEVASGLIVVDGEIIRFKGGVKKDKFKIKTVHEMLEAFGHKFPEAYTFRDAEFSDNGEYIWANIPRIDSIQSIKKHIENIRGDAPGTVKMWSGLESKIPSDYMLCDGRVLSTNEYPELFDNIGFLHGLEGTTGFKLPNLQGRFIVGLDIRHEDYKIVGNKGGAENVTLSVEQLANHKHIMPWGENPSTAWNPQWGYAPPPYNQAMRGSNSNDGDNSWAYSSDVGENKPHENRPPFYTLAYIIKVR